MRATGIVRRIDDLGRVVIPKEIRRGLRIHEGDPLEIYTAHDSELGDHLILAKYRAAEVSMTDLLKEFKEHLEAENCPVPPARKYELNALLARVEEIVKN